MLVLNPKIFIPVKFRLATESEPSMWSQTFHPTDCMYPRFGVICNQKKFTASAQHLMINNLVQK